MKSHLLVSCDVVSKQLLLTQIPEDPFHSMYNEIPLHRQRYHKSNGMEIFLPKNLPFATL